MSGDALAISARMRLTRNSGDVSIALADIESRRRRHAVEAKNLQPFRIVFSPIPPLPLLDDPI